VYRAFARCCKNLVPVKRAIVALDQTVVIAFIWIYRGFLGAMT